MVFTSTTPETTMKVPTNTAGTTSHIEAPTETVLTTLTTNMPYKTTTSTKTVTSKNLPITSSVTGKSVPLTTTYMTGITTNIATSLSPITDYLPTENSTLTTPSLPLTNTIGSAEVITKLLFNSTSPVPSEAMVLTAISKLKNSRESQLQKSVKVENVTYNQISDTSYVLILTFTVSNISMPEDADLRNRTFEHVQDMINDALNSLLNEPDSKKFEPTSSNFTRESNEINGNMAYTFQDTNDIKPVSFLNEIRSLMGLTSTKVPPHASVFPVTSVPESSGLAEVTSRLVFDSSPVPSEDLVLRAVNSLRNSRESKLDKSVEIKNVSYEKISDTSYAVIFKFSLTKVSMSDPVKEVLNITNSALNTLLNEPDSKKFEHTSSNFTRESNKINGNMAYTFQDTNEIKPVSFLNEIRSLMGLTSTKVPPHASVFPVTSVPESSGLAEVTSRLVFDSSPVPSEDLVLRAVNSLRNSRESKLDKSVEIKNVSYEKISDTSYAVIFKFSLTKVSMSDPVKEVLNITNSALNTLLNEPDSKKFEHTSSNFTRESNKINGNMAYTFQDTNDIKPVSFLNEIRSLMGLTSTKVPPHASVFPVTSVPESSGLAEVTSRLVFDSSPVPSEDLVLRAVNSLRNSRESKLDKSVEIKNVSYEKISDTSYAVIFKFSLTKVSMSDPVKEVLNITNSALNTLLNEPGSKKFEHTSSNFTRESDKINGNVAYTFQDTNDIKPVSFLNEIRSLMGLTTTKVPPHASVFPVTSVPESSGLAEVTSRLVFDSSPVPSEDLVLSAVNSLRNSRESKLDKSVELKNVSYEKISDTSYAVIFKFSLTKVSMSDPVKEVLNITNSALNTLLNEPDSKKFEHTSSNFTRESDKINGNVAYTFQDTNDIKPVSFLNEIRSLMGLTSTKVPPHASVFPVTSVPESSGLAEVTSRLVFDSSPVPSEDLVLRAVNSLRNSRESKLDKSVEIKNVSYEKISDTSYAVIFKFSLTKVSMSDPVKEVLNITNSALNTLLNEPDSKKFEHTSSNFTRESNKINGNMAYTFQDTNDIKPVSFLNEIRSLMGLTSTKVPPHASVFPVTSVPESSGLAEVTSRLVFDSSPVPSEDLVLRAVNSLRNSRESKLDKSVEIKNVSYEKISDTSYAVIFKFSLTKVSMSDPVKEVLNITNSALNTLLNEPGSKKFEHTSSNFTRESDKINGNVAYTFQDTNDIKPVSFLNEIRSLMGLTSTKVPPHASVFPVTSVPESSGLAEVTSRLVFDSSPVPSEDLMLSAVNSLRNSRESKLDKSVEIKNVSYEKISDTSYAVIFKFSLTKVSMSDPVKEVLNITNSALNTLLNEPDSKKFEHTSSNFTRESDKINGNVAYTFQDTNDIKPVSFLNEIRSLMGLTTTKVPPHASVFPVTSVPESSGLAEVTSRLVFDSSPVPSEDLVLSAVNSLRNSRESKLDKSVEIKNVSYEKISDTSYAVIFKFRLTNVSMSDPVNEVVNMTNTALNTLLNEPEIPFDAPLANFTKNGKQIEVHMDRVFNDAYKIKPVSFLKELESQKLSQNKLIEGKAVIRIHILVEPLGPIPSDKAILEVISLLDSRFTTNQKGKSEKLGEPVSFQNVTFQKISDNSYALDFGFEINNVSMAENKGNRNSTYKVIQDAINKLLNEILNENPSADKINFDDANFTNDLAEVTADVVYNVSKSKIKAPSKFLIELFKDTTPNRLGTAIIFIRLVFITRGPLPTKSAVLQAANKLLESRLRTKREVPKLNEPVSYVNVNYTELSNNSYALDFGFEISDVNMSEKIVLRDSTHILVQDSINKLLSLILNNETATLPTFILPKTNFTGTDTVIRANVEYVFKDDDIKFPSPFLTELLNVNNGLTPTTVPPQPTRFPVTSVPEIKGKAVIRIRILVETLGPIPSEKDILEVISSLDSRFTTNQKGRSEKLGEPVSFQNVLFKTISDNSYALDFGFEINNVSMAENKGNRKSTYKVIQDAINKLLNEILHENPSADKINFDDANFTNDIAEVTADVVYSVSKSNITAPSKFLLKLFEGTTPNRLGKVIIVIRLVFNTRGPVPTESAVLKIANSLLDSRLRTKREVTKLNDPVSNVNVTYTKLSNNSYALDFGFEIINVNMSERLVLRNSTYDLIQDSINKLLNQILNDPNAKPFVFDRANFTGSNGVIMANVEYVFKEDDFKFPSPFIFELNYQNSGSTTAAPTTTFFPSSTSPTWIVAIIVPCAIAIMLIPCWILLCCLLCGCCARLRQRWHRRRSYNVQYTTRNSIF